MRIEQNIAIRDIRAHTLDDAIAQLMDIAAQECPESKVTAFMVKREVELIGLAGIVGDVIAPTSSTWTGYLEIVEKDVERDEE